MHNIMTMAQALGLSVPDLVERLERGEERLLLLGQYAATVADALTMLPGIAREWQTQTGQT